jgi:2-C-methyl-D-erythritol 4-phosphate cytidylyltransferase/2-C-methyl-D-erythritol 2,4-cyclodiphosphate synthase
MERQTGSTVAAVIVAAGRGERAGHAPQGPKQYRAIGGLTVLARTIAAFRAQAAIGPIVVAIHRDDEALYQACVGDQPGVRPVIGGATRQESTRLALLSLGAERPDIVLIHDGVRPFVDADLLARVLSAVAADRGVIPALPVSDTLKKAKEDGVIAGTVPRQGLYAAQTPQAFAYPAICAAHERAHAAGRDDFTDDAAIAEWSGLPVAVVAGSPDNVKLTWARDLAMADERLSRGPPFPDVRTGNGYDVHAFEPGDAVILCGVAIPHDRQLAGHSDADVALHALTDALLATCSAGDIGTHFPPSDPKWKGAASRHFIAHAVGIVRARGGRIANADVTLICEAPRIGPFRPAMTAALAEMLGVAADRVSVKATTNEKLGFVGRGEGIAAIATASVIYPGEVPQ